MAYLGDFVGQLMAEIELARLQADLEAVRIAELYASHDLLRHFPVPRVRLPDVEIDLPIVNRATADDVAERTFASAEDIAKGFQPAAIEYLASIGIELPSRRASTLRRRLLLRAEPHNQVRGIPVNVSKLSSEFAEETLAILTDAERERFSQRDLTSHAREIGALVRRRALELQPEPSRLEVGITPEEIRDSGDAAIVTIHLRISEEGLEWTSVESDGRTVDKLVVE